MRTKSIKVIIPLFIILLIQVVFLSGRLTARQSKDIILVLDTSMSMIGQAGGQNILDKVKQSIKGYIDKNVEDGDRVTFVTFDTDARIYPTVIVDDDNDRDILKKYITMTEATGLWTYTYKMIGKVLDEAEKLGKEKNGRKTEIVIMTDALDDPPPSELKKFNLQEYAEKYGKKMDLWIYILSFSNIKKSEAAQKLTKDMTKITEKVKVIETAEPQKGTDILMEEVKKEDQKASAASSCGNILIPLLIAIACIIVVLAVIFLIKKMAGVVVSGKLEYWNNELIDPVIQRIDLGRRSTKEAVIGKGFGYTLNIRDINIKTPFIIKAVRQGGAVRMQVAGSGGTVVEMVNRESDNLLRDGDLFKAGNYTFKYFAS